MLLQFVSRFGSHNVQMVDRIRILHLHWHGNASAQRSQHRIVLLRCRAPLLVPLRQMAKLDLAMDETVRRQARELADTFDARAQLEDTVTLAPRNATPTADGAVARRTQRTGAVIIRDPRLTRARTLGDQSGGADETGARTSATQEIGAISEAMEVLSAEMGHH